MNYTLRDQQLRTDFIKLHKRATYGTAGFRDLATKMPYVLPPPSRSCSEWEHWSPSTTRPSPTNI